MAWAEGMSPYKDLVDGVGKELASIAWKEKQGNMRTQSQRHWIERQANGLFSRGGQPSPDFSSADYESKDAKVALAIMLHQRGDHTNFGRVLALYPKVMEQFSEARHHDERLLSKGAVFNEVSMGAILRTCGVLVHGDDNFESLEFASEAYAHYLEHALEQTGPQQPFYIRMLGGTPRRVDEEESKRTLAKQLVHRKEPTLKETIHVAAVISAIMYYGATIFAERVLARQTRDLDRVKAALGLTQSILNLGISTLSAAVPGASAGAHIVGPAFEVISGAISYKLKYDKKGQPQDLRGTLNRNLRKNLLVLAESGKVVPGLVSDKMEGPKNAIEQRVQSDRKALGRLFSTQVVRHWCLLSGAELHDPALTDQVAGEVVLEQLQAHVLRPAPNTGP